MRQKLGLVQGEDRPMTREDWKKVEDRLRFPGAGVSLRVDGLEVFLQVRTDKMKMVIQVFIGGLGAW
jgi:hypothetical protein